MIAAGGSLSNRAHARRLSRTVAIICFLAIVGFAAARGQGAESEPRQINAKSDFGLACDGKHDDTEAFSQMLKALSDARAPATVIFPGPEQCLVAAENYEIKAGISFRGSRGGGLTIAKSTKLRGSLLRWRGSGAVSVVGFTLDLNMLAPSGRASGMFFGVGQNVTLKGSKIVNGLAPEIFGDSMLLVQGYGLTSCNIEDNLFSLKTQSRFQNQSLNLGALTAPIKRCRIIGNRSINTGFIVAWGDDILFENNDISGWGFGAAIAVGPASGAAAHIIIKNNHLHDSAMLGPDPNNTSAEGVESWYNNTIIANNRIQNTCGTGITFGGSAQVTDNYVSGAGKCKGRLGTRSGIGAAATKRSNPSGSVVSGNCVVAAKGDAMLYGYLDNSAIGRVTLRGNNFGGAAAPYLIRGGSRAEGDQSLGATAACKHLP